MHESSVTCSALHVYALCEQFKMVDERKTVAFSKFRLYTSWDIKNKLLYYLRILVEKILYLCILIPLSEYIRTRHWETIFQFRDFKITVTTWYQKRLLYCEILGLVTVTNWLIERLTWLTYKLTNWITDLLTDWLRTNWETS